MHTDHFVLIDSNRYVRGYYHGLDSASLAKLSEDIVLLTLEKGPKEKSFFAGKLQLIAVVFLLAIVGVGIIFILHSEKNHNTCYPVWKKDDKKARTLIFLFSIIVFAAIVVLSRVKWNVNLGFDVHLFAKANAIINSCVVTC